MKNLILRYCTSATEKIIPRWEQDYRLQPFTKLGLFYEYLEMGKRGSARWPLDPCQRSPSVNI